MSMNFYLYNDKITPEYQIPESENKDSLKKITINEVDENHPNHNIHISINENAIMVKVGDKEPHPMDDEEYIEWIMLVIDEKVVNTIALNKNAEPTAVFMIQNVNVEELQQNHSVYAYIFCNKTGMWRKKL